jgi:hypothetical protein
MREAQAHRRNSKYRDPWTVVAADVPWVATLNDEERAFVEMKASEVREDQFIAALDHRNEARRIAQDRSGETAANERLEQLSGLFLCTTREGFRAALLFALFRMRLLS